MGVWRKGVSVAQLEVLYRARGDHFARVAAAVTGDGELGRDAVQDGFATGIRMRTSFRGEGPLGAWVWRIVVNTAHRYAREGRHELFEAAVEQGDSGADTDELGVRAWIAALPERQRQMVFLRYYADLDYRQIAEVLAVEVGTVSATLSAAHRTLRSIVEEVRG
jgi:RNA polymerase sigma-70 factor (ECF subfamily)